MRILNFGSLNLDHTYTMDHFVQPGETTSALGYNVYFGGKGHNQSIALAKAGANVWHAGLIGADGENIRQHMRRLGVHTEYTKSIDTPTGHAMIQVDKNGQNSIIVYPGANGAVDEAFADEVLAHFTKGDILLLQNEISCMAHIMQKAKELGMRIWFNPSPCTEDILDYPLGLVDVFIMNEVEGAFFSKSSEPEGIIAGMHSSYPGAEIVLTLGERGAYYSSGGQCIFQPAFPTAAVDTTAAGDTFTGYFITWLLNGEGAKLALEAAATAAAIAVSVPGAASSIPSRDAVMQRLEA